MDFALSDSLDLLVIDGEIVADSNNTTAVICALFTDARFNNQRGYWLDLNGSTLWKFGQARLTEQSEIELDAAARSVVKKLVTDGLFKRIEVRAGIDQGLMTLELKCYDDGSAVIERKFVI